MDLIIEIGIIFVIAALLGYIFNLFKQPIIPAYIVAGVILAMLGIIEENSLVGTMSLLGIAFLLFLVGLEIDMDRLKDVGLVTSLGGGLLTILIFGIGFFIGGALGFATLESVYIGLIIAFSSTMIVVKMLSDKNQIETLHGRIIIGILLVQDILAIIALFVLTTINNFNSALLINTFLLVIVLGIIIYLLAKFVFPLVFKFAAKSEELLFIVSIAIVLLFIGVFHYLNFSIIIGAFIAGVVLGNLPYNLEIIALAKPLRDFFAVVFFVSLGMQLKLLNINNTMLITLIVIILFVLFIKPFLTMFMVLFFGYKTRPAFATGFSLGQVSEFSLILVMLGLSLNHLSQNFYSSVILITIVTMILTPYFVQFEPWFYHKFSRSLKVFEKVTPQGHLEYIPEEITKDVLMVGYDRLGYNILDTLDKLKKNFLVIDYNPEVIKNLISKKIPCIYGDIGDLEIIHRLDLDSLKMIVSTIPNREDSLMLIKKTKEVNKSALLIVTATNVDDALSLYDAGADYVILPHFLGGERVSLFLEEANVDIKKILSTKKDHIKELRKRHRLKHHHPKYNRHHKK